MKTSFLHNNSVKKTEIVRFKNLTDFPYSDAIAVEEPLQISVCYGSKDHKQHKNISVTMRTPGNDTELAVGFLFTEGIISGHEQVSDISRRQTSCSRNQENIILVELADDFVPQLMSTERNFYTTSSCGVCGKGSIESIRTVSAFNTLEKEDCTVSPQTLYELPEKLQYSQNNFSSTGGIHASGLFDLKGNLLALREDVGRHNALDKLIGYVLLKKELPLRDKILLLSGRAGFELIQKAAMASIPIVAAIGAPSSLAIDLAKEFDITLLGFLRDNRFNLYHLGKHVKIDH